MQLSRVAQRKCTTVNPNKSSLFKEDLADNVLNKKKTLISTAAVVPTEDLLIGQKQSVTQPINYAL